MLLAIRGPTHHPLPPPRPRPEPPPRLIMAYKKKMNMPKRNRPSRPLESCPWPEPLVLRRRWRRAAERDAAILRDHIRDAASQQRDACIVISLAEIRDHLAAEATDFAVGQDWFQAIADLRPVFVIVYGEENQHAAGGLLGADAPLRCYVQGIIFDGAIAQ